MMKNNLPNFLKFLHLENSTKALIRHMEKSFERDLWKAIKKGSKN